MIEMNFVNVPTTKEKISITRHMKHSGGTTPAKSNQQVVVSSGELNVRFRLKLISLERINILFDEVRMQVATDNLETIAKNVTLD